MRKAHDPEILGYHLHLVISEKRKKFLFVSFEQLTFYSRGIESGNALLPSDVPKVDIISKIETQP